MKLALIVAATALSASSSALALAMPATLAAPRLNPPPVTTAMSAPAAPKTAAPKATRATPSDDAPARARRASTRAAAGEPRGADTTRAGARDDAPAPKKITVPRSGRKPAAPDAPPAMPAISRDDAQDLAMKYLQKRFDTEWKTSTAGLKVDITPTDNQFQSDATHPITGKGVLVSMVVHESATADSTRMQKLRFGALSLGNRYKVRRFDVLIDEKGNAMQLDTLHLDAWSKLKAWSKPFLALPSNQFDKTIKDLGTSALAVAGGAAVGGPWLAAGAVVLKAHDFYKEAQTVAQNKQNAMIDATAAWAKIELKAGRTPTLDEAYLHYADELNHDNVGSHLPALNAQEFSRLLKAKGY